jgi:uncharacterized protein GlcG (DUF336 family)
METVPDPGDPLFTQRLTNPYGAPVSIETARKATAAAIAEGKKNGWTVAVAVVDPGGVLVYFERMDGTLTASSDIAIGKARSAVAFKRSTKLFEDGILAGRLQNLGLPGALPIEGGVPLIEDGRIVGAIGVSGARPEQDGVCVKPGPSKSPFLPDRQGEVLPPRKNLERDGPEKTRYGIMDPMRPSGPGPSGP